MDEIRAAFQQVAAGGDAVEGQRQLVGGGAGEGDGVARCGVVGIAAEDALRLTGVLAFEAAQTRIRFSQRPGLCKRSIFGL